MRKDKLTFFVLSILNINLYFVTNCKLRVVSELVDRDDTLALVTDVYKNLSFANSNYSTLYYLILDNGRKSLAVHLLNFLFRNAILGIAFKCIPVKFVNCY